MSDGLSASSAAYDSSGADGDATTGFIDLATRRTTSDAATFPNRC